jgi:hypothetical protein
VTGRLTDRQVGDLVALVRDAIDARSDYGDASAQPIGATVEEQEAWDRRVSAAHDAALAAERAAVAAIRALRGAS